MLVQSWHVVCIILGIAMHVHGDRGQQARRVLQKTADVIGLNQSSPSIGPSSIEPSSQWRTSCLTRLLL